MERAWSRMNTSVSLEKSLPPPPLEGCSTRYMRCKYPSCPFFYGRLLQPFPRARMSACSAVSSISSAPISQLAEMRLQSQINDLARSRRSALASSLQVPKRTSYILYRTLPSLNIHPDKTNIIHVVRVIRCTLMRDKEDGASQTNAKCS